MVAISIPVFTSQLEKSRDAVSISNIRAAYAEAQAAYLTGTGDSKVTVTKSDNVISTIKVADVVTKGQVASDTFSGLNAQLPFASLLTTEPAAGTHTLTFTYDANGAITAVTFDAA